MKVKFLSFVMACVVAVGFTACDTKKTDQSAEASSASASEQVEEEKTLEPTGDAAADAKQCVEEFVDQMNKGIEEMKSPEDALKFDDKVEEIMMNVEKKYEDFYKAKGDDQLKLFKEEFDKLEKDPEISKKVDEIMVNAQKKVEELTKAAEKTVNEAQEKVEK